MKINGELITAKKFAFDGCHKIYLVEDEDQEREAREMGYSIRPIKEIEETYGDACSLRFIANWELDRTYVRQVDDDPVEFS